MRPMLAPRPIWLPWNFASRADDPIRKCPPASIVACSTRCRYFRPRLLPRERIFPSFGLKSSSRVMAMPHGQSHVSNNMRKQCPRADRTASPSPCGESMTSAEEYRSQRTLSLYITMGRQRKNGTYKNHLYTERKKV